MSKGSNLIVKYEPDCPLSSKELVDKALPIPLPVTITQLKFP